MNTSITDTIKDLIFLKENNLLSKSNKDDIWTSRANESQNLFSENLENILKNFRRIQLLINENPRFNISRFNRLIPYKNMVFKSLIQKYNLLNNDEKKLLKNELIFLEIGNPYFVNYDGVKFNKRWLHNIRYTQLIKKYLNDIVEDKNSLIIDIGGGYGVLGYMLNKINFKGTYLLVEFPEQLIAAQYFLKSSLPNKNISSLKFFYKNLEKIDNKTVKNFDIFFCPCEQFDKLRLANIDLVTNFFSFGEMSKKNFKNYLDSNIIKTTKYIFYINRFYSNNEYSNDISILDYNLNNFNKVYFDIHKLEDTYIKQVCRFFGQEKNTNSQFFEIIGKNEK